MRSSAARECSIGSSSKYRQVQGDRERGARETAPPRQLGMGRLDVVHTTGGVERQKAPTDPSVETVKGNHIPVAAWPVT